MSKTRSVSRHDMKANAQSKGEIESIFAGQIQGRDLETDERDKLH